MYRKMDARVYLISKVHNLTDLLETTPCMRKLENPKTKDVGDQEDYVEESDNPKNCAIILSTFKTTLVYFMVR